MDASIVSAPSSTKNKDRKRDPKMKQTKKGNQWYFGMKIHIGSDTQGHVHSIAVTDASAHDSVVVDDLVHHGEETYLYGDKAYTSKERKETAESSGVTWRINHKAKRGKKLKCNWRHTMVPHGYTNKALLHNVNDVGSEAGLTPCTTFVFEPAWGGPPFVRARPPKNFPPYYYNAMLAVTNFATSGSWTLGNCRGPGYMTEACANPP